MFPQFVRQLGREKDGSALEFTSSTSKLSYVSYGGSHPSTCSVRGEHPTRPGLPLPPGIGSSFFAVSGEWPAVFTLLLSTDLHHPENVSRPSVGATCSGRHDPGIFQLCLLAPGALTAGGEISSSFCRSTISKEISSKGSRFGFPAFGPQFSVV